MSLTSYQTAPPRDLERPIITAFATNAMGIRAADMMRNKTAQSSPLKSWTICFATLSVSFERVEPAEGRYIVSM